MSDFEPKPSGSVELERVSAHFDQWRAARISPKGRIPERLWAEAVELVGRFGISHVAQVLRLNVTALNRKIQASVEAPLNGPDGDVGRVANPPHFVPLNLLHEPGVRCSDTSFRFELEYPDGKRLRMSIRSLDQLQRILSLVASG